MKEVDKKYVQRFDQASSLAESGKIDDAMTILWQIVEDADNDESLQDKLEFIARVHIRKAWCLMDKDNFQEARQELENPAISAAMDNLDPADRYGYYFSYGNVLGEQGETERMEEAFKTALEIAVETKNATRAVQCWLNRLAYLELHGRWDELEEQSRACIQFSEKNGLAKMGLAGGLKRAKALIELNKSKNAASQLARVIRLASKNNEKSAKTAAQKLFESLY